MMLKGLIMKEVILVLILVFVLFKSCESGLTVSSKKCGQISCKEMEYCSKFGNICQACSDVCDSHTHNYEASTCDSLCQDYLHNKQFVKRSESVKDAATLAELARDVRTLKVVAWLSMAFSGLSVLLLLGLCVNKVSVAKKRHGSMTAMIRNTFFTFKRPQKTKDKGPVKKDVPDLKLDISSPGSLSHCTPTMPNTASTTLPSTPPLPSRATYSSKQRSPSEDATLDYAYDNAGMTPSPTFTKPIGDRANETNF